METSQLVFFVNGKKVVESNPDPGQTLLSYLRSKLLLTGTKYGCGQGACGSCTVMLSQKDRQLDKISHIAVTACLVPVCAVHGMSITTVEGVGSVNTKLHPVQEMLVKAHGTQCGYCTPGFVMSMYTLLRNNPTPTMEDVNKAIRGNLCRCTGYRPILDGFKPFTKDFCPMGDKCCQRTSQEGSTEQSTNEDDVGKPLYDPSQEPIFPSELQVNADLDGQYLVFQYGASTWLRPNSLNQLLRLKAQYPGSRVTAGNTSLGLERELQGKHYQVLLSVSKVAEMNEVVTMDTGVRYGAAVTLSTIEDHIRKLTGQETDPKLRSFKTFLSMLETFAALQIKNSVTVGGCIASSWSNSDILPLLCVLGAKIHIACKNKPSRVIDLNPEFFLGPGRTALQDPEVIIAVEVPYSQKGQYSYTIKQARRDFDTATVSLAAMVTIVPGSDVIKDANICLGNVLPRLIATEKLSAGLKGKRCDTSLADIALSLLTEDLASLPAPRASDADLRSLLEATVWKLTMRILVDISGEKAVPQDLLSAVTPLPSSLPQGTQIYEEVPPDQDEADSVGRPIPHKAARQQATGEAQYIDDIPHYENELFCALVTSPYGHARILSMSLTDALSVSGVVDILTAKDVPGKKQYGILMQDEIVFAEDEVTVVGHTVAAVIATSREIAESAAKLVEVQYEKLPCITTIQEAIKAQSFYEETIPLKYVDGDSDTAMSASDVIIEGEVEIQGQEHFYMETNNALVIPQKEDDIMKVYGPYQNIVHVQNVVATTLNIPLHKVAVECKRIGGAFGGKETKLMFTLPTAIAAFKHKRPVRCVADRDTDMQLTGGRHPAFGKYKVGVMKDGSLKALQLKYYLNGGYTADATLFVIQCMLFGFENSYRVDNVSVQGYACKTNIPSNTAFRAFGQPQSVFIMETIMTHVGEVLGISQQEVRERNLYRVGDPMHFNCSSEKLTVRRCWEEVLSQSDLKERRDKVEQYNRANKYRKRGIALGPLRFGLNYPPLVLNQGQALVNVYLDGSVLIYHGGVEMGQGLHTKVVQIASRALGLPVSAFHVNPTTTDVTNNVTGSGGSSTTDMHGGAVLVACEKLKSRIAPYKAAKPSGTWVEWVNDAYNDRVSLSVTGFFRKDYPNLGYDWETGKGDPFSYFTCGAACTEVEIDVLTGQHVVLRADIVMDVGRSLNPAIDIGQIEGAFLQGYGLYALEDLQFNSNGALTTKNALGYKIPVIANVPKDFRVSLLKDSDNHHNVYSSKGIGEPPLLSACTVLFAIREAVRAYREQKGLDGYFVLNAPATPERVRRLCPR